MIKVSWSILSAWTRGDRDSALNGILGIPNEKSPAMEEGSRIHKCIAEQKLKLLPFIDDSFIYEDVRPAEKCWQGYFRVQLFEDVLVSMVVDCYSPKKGILIDWKTGKAKSNSADPMQLYIYSLLLEKETKSKYSVGVVAKVSKDLKLEDYSSYVIQEPERNKAREFVRKTVEEIKEVL